MIIALDTETTGVDFAHGAKPFFVTITDDTGNTYWWEWNVNPLTREPDWLPEDLDQIKDFIQRADEVVIQNAKFDVAALNTLNPAIGSNWPWHKTRCTLMAGHLLASKLPHDLTSMVLMYLNRDIQPHEDALKHACLAARTYARREHPDWLIAKAGLPCMPSAKESTWKYDTWLPKQVAETLPPRDRDPSWLTVLSKYANADSASTLALYLVQRRMLKNRQLDRIYARRMELLPVIYTMERNGVTVNGHRLQKQMVQYQRELATLKTRLVAIAANRGVELELPKSGTNKVLREFATSPTGLNLERVASKDDYTETGLLSMAKASMQRYVLALQDIGAEQDQVEFVQGLMDLNSRATAVNYMEGYQRYWVKVDDTQHTYTLYPSLNPTGTDTLRFSSQNPNEQNISKKEGFNLRYSFGPGPGEEWYSADAENIELRIPAYIAGEQAMINLFEHPNDPPYYGSHHLLVAHILFPKEFEQCLKDGVSFKDRYKATLYQRVKNGNFAVQYGAIEASGTADRAYGIKGAQRLIQSQFARIKQLNDACIAKAKRTGCVETIANKSVDPLRGYPLMCSRSQWGEIIPTVPLNYVIQGTAMDWMANAMIRCQHQLNQWEAEANFKARIVMQVHDELVFAFPKAGHPVTNPKGSNRWRMNKLRALMEQGGEDIGVNIKVSVEYHPITWAEGEKVPR